MHCKNRVNDLVYKINMKKTLRQECAVLISQKVLSLELW